MSARKSVPREFESVIHAAQRTDYSVFTIREAIDRGDLPAYRLNDKPGAALRVKVSEVNALLRPYIPTEARADRDGGAA
jgi:hypothetical protein